MSEQAQALAAAQARLAASQRAIANFLRGGDAHGGGSSPHPDTGQPRSRPAAGAQNLLAALADKLLAPLARDRPWALVCAAALAGAALTARPRLVRGALGSVLTISPPLTGWALRAAAQSFLAANRRRPAGSQR